MINFRGRLYRSPEIVLKEFQDDLEKWLQNQGDEKFEIFSDPLDENKINIINWRHHHKPMRPHRSATIYIDGAGYEVVSGPVKAYRMSTFSCSEIDGLTFGLKTRDISWFVDALKRYGYFCKWRKNE